MPVYWVMIWNSISLAHGYAFTDNLFLGPNIGAALGRTAFLSAVLSAEALA
jgi:hypothetical protein